MGFRWIALCFALLQCGDVRSDPYFLHGTYGSFASPHFPFYYDNNLNINWTITVPKGLRVVVYFKMFDLEDSFIDGVTCAADYVEILDGGANANLTSGRLCGNPRQYRDDAPQSYTTEFRTTSNIATVRFVSDYSNDLPGTKIPRGFRAYYRAEDIDECAVLEEQYRSALYPEQVGKCDHHCDNYLGSYRCICNIGYTLASNGYTCKAKCSNNIITARAGLITSPGYPNNYPKLTDCDWTIKAGAGERIQLDFKGRFEVEDYITDACPYDWLKIIDDGVETKYCGSKQYLESVLSKGNKIKIEFHSDMVQEMKGFQISHKVKGVYCEQPTPPVHGRILVAYGAENGRLPFESVVVFECEVGYSMVGDHKISCVKDGTFDRDVPKCVNE